MGQQVEDALVGVPAGEDELTWRHLRGEAFEPVLTVNLLAGVALVLVAEHFTENWQGGLLGVLLMLASLAAGALRSRRYLLAVWILVAVWSGAVAATFAWLPPGAGACLLALPVGCAACFIGLSAGLLCGCAASAFVVAVARSGSSTVPSAIWATGLLVTWGVLLLMWLSSRPTETALTWSWQSYEQARQRLDLARDRQAELKQAIDELAQASAGAARLNQLLGTARRAAEEAERLKAEFVANVSHELRTPLNMILGFSELLMDAPRAYRGRLPPALLADLAVIHANSLHLSSLIDDVLDLSQIDAGRVALARERVRIDDIVASATAAVRPLYDSKGLDLNAEVSDGLPLVFCDRTRIRQVVLNLLSNAGRFTEHGGVRLKAWQEAAEVIVSVADTGPGIGPADWHRVFRPFEQLDGSIRRRHGGSGLGLAISRSFVELHGGRMWFESEVGRGTTFFFSLPTDPQVSAGEAVRRWLNPEWEYRQRVHPVSQPSVAVRPRLVVLEEEVALERLLSRYFDGWEVKPTRNLEQALLEVTETPARALLVNDSTVSAGLQRVQESRALPPDTPVIICSVPGVRQAAQALGAADYLVKPVSQEKLLAAMVRAQPTGGTVLVVDDEPEGSRLLIRMLASTGRRYRVLRATDGDEALRMMRQEHPDVVLLDLVMPGMDGFRILAAKRQDPSLRDIPVVIISAHDPVGQPIVTSALAVTRPGGLSVAHLLTCIEWLTQTLSLSALPVDRGPTAARAD